MILLKRKFPTQVFLEPEEEDRAGRAQLALALHKSPREIDAEPADDMADVIEILYANNQR